MYYICAMSEAERRAQGRPKKDPAKHKKNRGISMTDAEYAKLGKLAEAANMGISEYVINKCGLS